MRIIKSKLSVVALLLLVAPSCLACDCQTLTEGESFDEADAVVIGEVEREEARGSGSVAVLRVEETLKGDAAGELVIVSAGSNCDAPIHPGARYIVYTRGREGEYHASSCMRTRPLYATRPEGSRNVFTITLLSVLGSCLVGFLLGRFQRGAA
ncbi:MAG: hypothetical protein JOZ96_24305 [Acidobacteria bacterium]|nr:hypothetical protein [Acidobacteriota bacterium]